MSLSEISLSFQLFSLGFLNLFSCLYTAVVVCIVRFRTAVNIIIVNFAIACALAAVVRAWLDIYYTYYPTLFDQFSSYCIVREYIPYVNNCFPIYTLLMIIVNRYLVIQYPHTGIFQRKKWALLSSIIPWITAIILCTPQLVVGVQVNMLR